MIERRGGQKAKKVVIGARRYWWAVVRTGRQASETSQDTTRIEESLSRKTLGTLSGVQDGDPGWAWQGCKPMRRRRDHAKARDCWHKEDSRWSRKETNMKRQRCSGSDKRRRVRRVWVTCGRRQLANTKWCHSERHACSAQVAAKYRQGSPWVVVVLPLWPVVEAGLFLFFLHQVDYAAFNSAVNCPELKLHDKWLVGKYTEHQHGWKTRVPVATETTKRPLLERAKTDRFTDIRQVAPPWAAAPVVCPDCHRGIWQNPDTPTD